MISVLELRSMARSLAPDVLVKQLGPFALIQRPTEEVARQQALRLGAKRTVLLKSSQRSHAPADLLLEIDHLIVATLPPLQDVEELTVGRLPDCELVIDDPSVSKRHAVLRWDAQAKQCCLTDLGSTNGTLLNESDLWEPETVLHDWDVLTFGDVPFCFVRTETLQAKLAPR